MGPGAGAAGGRRAGWEGAGGWAPPGDSVPCQVLAAVKALASVHRPRVWLMTQWSNWRMAHVRTLCLEEQKPGNVCLLPVPLGNHSRSPSQPAALGQDTEGLVIPLPVQQKDSG